MLLKSKLLVSIAGCSISESPELKGEKRVISIVVVKSIITLSLITASVALAEPVTYNNLPLGTEKEPLIFRSYLPDPGLEEDYFKNHGKGENSPKYNVGTGQDAKGVFPPIKGLPAAIGVNHGPALSYAFDTVECRIAYAWQGGFLDMYPYWGDAKRGNRLSHNYVSHLVGILFYQADPLSEIYVQGKRLTELPNPKYIGYDIKENIPTFRFSRGGHKFSMTLTPSSTPLSFNMHFKCEDNVLVSHATQANEEITNEIKVTITGKRIASFQGFPRNTKIKKASVANGQLLFGNLGCIACHSTDGTVGHGPTLMGLYDSERLIEESDKPVKADKAYILESIKEPNAKTAKDFPPNYMPPYKLTDPEYESLVLYIQSVAKGE